MLCKVPTGKRPWAFVPLQQHGFKHCGPLTSAGFPTRQCCEVAGACPLSSPGLGAQVALCTRQPGSGLLGHFLAVTCKKGEKKINSCVRAPAAPHCEHSLAGAYFNTDWRVFSRGTMYALVSAQVSSFIPNFPSFHFFS